MAEASKPKLLVLRAAMAKVLGIELYNKDIYSAVELIAQQCVYPSSNDSIARCVSASGAHGLVLAQKDKSFFDILSSFYINLPDGMPTVWIGRLKKEKQMKRCYGPDFFKEMIESSASKNIKHFFCGGKTGVADELKKKCQEKFNNNNITQTFSPPFREMTDEEMSELGKLIDSTGSHIIWIGLSTPKQEKFAFRLKQFTTARFIITVGAAFDFHTGKVRQAPKWVQKAGMEWMFRLMMEPKRLYRRYIEIVPLFIFYNIKELLFFFK